ncbi:MAG: hypothetical protein EOP20_01100 [Hyphomicrobiales bacterium]|nr:MAG: hypothetical protein EOP20_01100 [Hyphomicrobiales bacterium]
MPTFNITAPSGKKYRITGDTAEGALAALQQSGLEDGEASSGLDAQQLSGLERGKALAAARMRGEDVALPGISDAAAADPRSNQPLEDNALHRIAAFTTAGVNGVPIVGPALTAGVNATAGAARALTDGTSFGDEYARNQELTGDLAEQFPNTALAGKLTGNIAAMLPVGATALGARALGMSQAGLGARVLASGASASAIDAADTTVRGGSLNDIVYNAGVAGLLGGGVPIAGHLLKSGYRAVADGIGSRLRGAINPEQVAGERVGKAITADRANPGERVLGPADDASAIANGQPLLNIDRGGETTRALGRVAANTNPEARATISNLADERFAGQGDRGIDFVKRIMGGNVDDLGLQERIKDIARITNAKAYRAAEASPAAQQVWDADLAQLMQSPAVQRAAREATARSANRVAVSGGTAVDNPFTFVNGRAVLKKQANGTTAVPSLRFWDQVKRNLDGQIGEALTKDRSLAGDLQAINKTLVSKLDGLVPEYQAARRGAAAAFGADDAVDAGKIYARQVGNVPEMERAIAKFTPAEKKAFEVGYASEIVDKIRATNDRTSAVRMFKSPEMRAKFDMALGPQKTKELEAFVRVEDAMDKVRGAMGNSTTARQLYEMAGIGAIGGGASYATGDPKYMAYAAAVGLTKFALRQGTAKVDERVMKKVADLLVSSDPKAIEKAIRQAAFAPQYLAAVDAISKAAGLISRAGAIQ